jgi:hypothetical protein
VLRELIVRPGTDVKNKITAQLDITARRFAVIGIP